MRTPWARLTIFHVNENCPGIGTGLIINAYPICFDQKSVWILRFLQHPNIVYVVATDYIADSWR